ncbi:hypothetical protein TELCIR_08339 [Teladorsagia circumcincta]|uniref:Uncharacterized protein n=1 Tax=Teladorsagia circumcincta TaxID=45464 RepID=A0A2G9UHV8_TELCI|nr:hypothetical protein TELCIR_08339 [Teladorsagia circumcincta]
MADTAFSVSAAKAFFEAAKKPEVRAAAVAAAKNPFVRSVAKSAATNPETRNQLIAALERQYGAKSPDVKPSPPAKPKHDDVAPAPPPPPPHRATSSHSTTSTSYSSSSYTPHKPAPPTTSDYSKPLPSTPSTSSYRAPAPSNGAVYPSLVNELQELQLNSPGGRKPAPLKSPPPIPASNRVSVLR